MEEEEQEGFTGSKGDVVKLANDIGLPWTAEALDIPDHTAVWNPAGECIDQSLLGIIATQQQADIMNNVYRPDTPLKIGDRYIHSPFIIMLTLMPIAAYVRISRVLNQIIMDQRGVGSDVTLGDDVDIRVIQEGTAQQTWEQILTLCYTRPNILAAYFARSGCVTTMGKLKEMLLSGEIDKDNAQSFDAIPKAQTQIKRYVSYIPMKSARPEMWPMEISNFNGVPYAIALGGPHHGQVMIPPWSAIPDIILGQWKVPPAPDTDEGMSEEEIRKWWVPISNVGLITHLTGNLFDETNKSAVERSAYLSKLNVSMRGFLAVYLRSAVALAQISCAYSNSTMRRALLLRGNKTRNGFF